MSNVNVGTGEVCHFFTDFSLRGIIPVEFSRLYRSGLQKRETLGFGWTHTLQMTLSGESDRIVFREGQGTERSFAWIGPGESSIYAADTPQSSTLMRDLDGFTLIMPDRKRLIFRGHLEGGVALPVMVVQDMNGNALGFEYGIRKQLIGLTDTWDNRLQFAYDSSGRLIHVYMNSPDGEYRDHLLAAFTYSGDDLVSATDALGHSQVYEYDHHLLVKHTNRLGGSCHFQYDEKRRCRRTWRDGGIRFRSFEFDDTRKTALATDGLGRATVYRIDDNGLVNAVVDPLGNTSHALFTEDGEFMAAAGEGSGVPPFQIYDPESRRLILLDSLGQTTTFTFDKNNRAVNISEGDASSDASYDERGNLAQIRTPSGALWSYAYDSLGLPVVLTAPTGQRVDIQRSADRRRGTISDQLGTICSFVYGSLGQLVRVTDALGNTTYLDHDSAGRLIGMRAHDGSATRYAYDAEGNLIAYTDETGKTRSFEYNAFGICTARVDGLGNRVQYEYDVELQLAAVVDPKGDRMSFEYDNNGRPIRQTFFDGRSYSLQYNRDGRLSTIRDTDLKVELHLHYNEIGQTVAIDFGGGFVRRYEYDEKRRLISASNGDHVIRWKFDPEGRLIEENSPDSSLAYEYDALGNCTALRDNLGHSTTFQYDIRSRLSRLINPAGGEHRFEYDALDRLVCHRMPNQCEDFTTYTTSSRIASRSVRTKQGEILHRRYEYDAADRLIKLREPDNTRKYVYDDAGRVVHTDSDKFSEQYVYDAANNLVYSSGTGRIDYERGGRISTAGYTKFTFNPGGSLYARVDEDAVTTYEFAMGQLQRIERTGRTATTFTYDALDRRLQKSDSAGTTRFSWAQHVPYAEHRTAPSGEEVRTYSFLPRTFVPLDFTAGDRTYSYVVDPFGTPTEVLDDNGRIVWTADLTIWGSVKKVRAKGIDNPLRFQGQYDDGTGLYYNRYRYYDPAVGRYLSPDPLGLAGGINPYQYGPDPVNTIDPLGLAPLVMPPSLTSSATFSHTTLPCTPTPAAPPGCGPSNPPASATPNQGRGCGTAPNLRGGGGVPHNTALDEIDKANGLSTSHQDFRVNQQQVTAGSVRVGRNRPDMQVTMGGQRNYVEADTPPATRAGCHAHQICNNDPAGVIHLVTL